MAVAKLALNDSSDPIFTGDTWDGFLLEYSEDGVPRNLTGASIRMTLVSDSGGIIALTSTGNHFEITNPTGGVVVCKPINRMDYPAGVYNGDLEITFSDSTRYTPFLVTMFLLEDTTK